jgi:hypothetical protein
MKQKLLIFFALILLILLLAGLNAATYVQKEKVADTEFGPNRSTYNSGSTGTQAFYSLLSETGRNVTRWETPLDSLRKGMKNEPAVLVMIGPLRRALTDVESANLMEWVAGGGTLILIDREPQTDLLATTSQWKVSVPPQASPDLFVVDATDQKQMTADKPAEKPMQPSYFSRNVNAVQPSRFASAVKVERYSDVTQPKSGLFDADETENEDTSPPPPEEEPRFEEGPAASEKASFEAPVVHFGGKEGNLLVEAPFSEGRVIVLSDPFIIANNGISIVDNAQLGINLVTWRAGLIAFDEYHHGYGGNNNRVFQYFEGTPIIAIFLQCGLLVALIFLSQSRRFARPIPEPEPSRLSKLEYVSAMAELQQRTRAYDLAIENVYADFRRRASALVGLDNTATRTELAKRIAERIRSTASDIEELLFKCEDTIYGTPIGKKETVALIARLRDLEEQLGLKRAPRKGL